MIPDALKAFGLSSLDSQAAPQPGAVGEVLSELARELRIALMTDDADELRGDVTGLAENLSDLADGLRDWQREHDEREATKAARRTMNLHWHGLLPCVP